jgi:preprotein translocase subunit SecG
LIMIGICVAIIISQNLLNNPFEVLHKLKAMRANTLSGGAVQAGGDKEQHLIALERFNASLLDNKESFMTHVTVAFTIMFSVIFLCYRLLNNTLRYKSELFNGKLFAESICYT